MGFLALACFVMPNSPIIDEKPLTAFQVPVRDVERMTGLSIFKEHQRNSYPMCKQHKCDGSYGSFSRSFRQVGQLRAARTKVELEQRFQKIGQEQAAAGQKLESSVLKEYEHKMKHFA